MAEGIDLGWLHQEAPGRRPGTIHPHEAHSFLIVGEPDWLGEVVGIEGGFSLL